MIEDRTAEGVAAVAADLLSSGESVVVAVADVPRRRAALERILAGVGPGGLAVASWRSVEADPVLAAPFRHVVALDPPTLPAGPGFLSSIPGPEPRAFVHLAWGEPEVEFARAVVRAELDLRPALVEVYRALRELGEARDGALEAALRGGGRHPRAPEVCAGLLRVLLELGLVDYAPSSDGGPACTLRNRGDTPLELSSTYRAYRLRLEAIERSLGAAALSTRKAAVLPGA